MPTTVKKISQLISSFCLLVSCSAAMAIEVGTCAELDEAINVARASVIELTNDIECGDHLFAPAAGLTFMGHFDGRGYAINNLQIVSGQSYNAGLFEIVYGATIENLTINSPAIDNTTGAGFSTAGLLGSMVIASTINAVSVKDFKITTDISSFSVLANIAINSEFNDIVIDDFIIYPASISAGLVNFGTVAGTADNVTINNAVIKGNVYAINSYSWCIGGVVGQATDVRITNSDVTINLGSERIAAEIGGVAGRIDGSSLIENVNVQGEIYGGDQVGGLAGNVTSSVDTKINNSTFDGEVLGHQWVGGLVGEMDDATIVASSAVGLVEGRLGIGGLVGEVGFNVNISKSYSDNTVNSYDIAGGATGGLIGNAGFDVVVNESYSNSEVYSENNQNVGGLVGLAKTSSLVISNSFFTGQAIGPRSIGGLLGGSLGSVHIINSYAVGVVLGNAAGGLVGTSNGAITAENSYWDINTTGQPESAQGQGEGKTTAEMQNQATYINWDFDTIWQPIKPGHPGYPQLRWQSESKALVSTPQIQ